MNLGLREHVVSILRHWVEIAVVMIVAVGVTGAIGFLSSKTYVAETRVLILTRSPAERATSSRVLDNGQVGSPQDQVLTQVEILKSPVVALRLAEELGPDRVLAAMTWRWDWLRALPTKWRNNAIIALSQWAPTSQLIRMSGIPIPTNVSGPPTAEEAAERLSDALHVEPILKTDLFGAAFTAPDPAFAEEALNRMIEIYSKHVIALGRPVRAAEIAQSEADRLAAELRVSERQLRDYTEANGILSITRQKDLLLDRLSRVQEDRAGAQLGILESIAKIDLIQTRIQQLPREEAVSMTTMPNPLVDRLSERLAQLETELGQFVPGSPSANKVQIEIDGTRAQLAQTENAVRGPETFGTSALYQQLQATLTQEEAERRAYDERVAFLAGQQADLERELGRLDDLELRYVELDRAARAKEEALRFAVQQREETSLADQLSTSNSLSQVIQVEPAVEPSAPVAPRRSRLLALGVIVGFMAGIALAYLLEFNRRTMAVRREAELALGLPVFGLQYRTGLLGGRKRANEDEMRIFAARVLHDARSGKGRNILLVDAGRKSGASAVAAALAETLHALDADVIHVRLVPVKDRKDPAQVTFRDIAPRADAAMPVGAFEIDEAPRFDTATITARPGALRTELEKLLKAQSARRDVAVIDGPETGRLPEIAALAGSVDSVFPVVAADQSRVSDVLALVDMLTDIGGRVPGTIFTNQRQNYPSWAFCWISGLRLRARRDAAAQLRPQ